MRKLPKELVDRLSKNPYYKICARKNHQCGGRITWEHVLIFAGKQVNEEFSIIPLCEFHHAVNQYQDRGDLNKEINEWIALNRATDEELSIISKAINYISRRTYLNSKYGRYVYRMEKKKDSKK